MINKAQARERVVERIKDFVDIRDSIDLVIADEFTLEEDFGWVFFYTSKQYLDTNDIQCAVGGNSPIVVNKEDGSLHDTGTAMGIEHYIENYRKTGDAHGKWK